ncbi:MAG: acyl-CoA dehydrogenase family protein, partial [Thermodesulfobacteriota bacterium]|nr:acyl-CoA dehydrogenase family protein [Thermodesulfobacteriota bacterium]
MDFKYLPEEQAYQDKFKAWLNENLPEGFGTPAYKPPETWDEKNAMYRKWQRKLFDAGYAGINWPKEYGGQGLSLIYHLLVADVLTYMQVFPNVNVIGFGMCGPTIISCGTEEQKNFFVPRLLNGEHVWCQLFSEPNAGSDVASLSTKAVKDGDSFIMNGQKVWITMAHFSDYAVLLARTDPTVAKHKGLSYFIVDMKSPGITVRPIMTMSEETHFNEVFFEDVRVPRENLIGEEGQGWQVAIVNLMHERAAGASSYGMHKRHLEGLIELAKKTKYMGTTVAKDPIFRQKIAQMYVEVELMRYNDLRVLSKVLKGEMPGPEGSFGKLYHSEMGKRLLDTVMEMEGPYAQLMKKARLAKDNGVWQEDFLSSYGGTIAAGTSE